MERESKLCEVILFDKHFEEFDPKHLDCCIDMHRGVMRFHRNTMMEYHFRVVHWRKKIWMYLTGLCNIRRT